MGQLALHVRFPNESHEPLWARNVRPLRLPDPCPLAQTPVVVCKVSGPPVLGYASNWVWAPRCSATHTSRGNSRRALLVLGSRWPSCIRCLRPILQNCRHHETHHLGHHRRRPTVRDDTNFNDHQQLHRPITRHHGRGPCKCMLLPFARPPLWREEGGRGGGEGSFSSSVAAPHGSLVVPFTRHLSGCDISDPCSSDVPKLESPYRKRDRFRQALKTLRSWICTSDPVTHICRRNPPE